MLKVTDAVGKGMRNILHIWQKENAEELCYTERIIVSQECLPVEASLKTNLVYLNWSHLGVPNEKK